MLRAPVLNRVILTKDESRLHGAYVRGERDASLAFGMTQISQRAVGEDSVRKVDDLIPFEQVLEEELRDPEFRAEWERLAPARALANRLIGLRVDHGLTQTALARQIGVSPETIFRLETGEHSPSPRTLARIESFAESTGDR